MSTDAPDQAESWERRLLRRRRITARPARLRIRRRNPCFFFRLRLFGWYVRFTHGLLERPGRGGAPGRGARQSLLCTRAQVEGRVYGQTTNISNRAHRATCGNMSVLCWRSPARRDTVPLPRRTGWPRLSGQLFACGRAVAVQGDASKQAWSSPGRDGGRWLLHMCGHSCGQSGSRHGHSSGR